MSKAVRHRCKAGRSPNYRVGALVRGGHGQLCCPRPHPPLQQYPHQGLGHHPLQSLHQVQSCSLPCWSPVHLTSPAPFLSAQACLRVLWKAHATGAGVSCWECCSSPCPCPCPCPDPCCGPCPSRQPLQGGRHLCGRGGHLPGPEWGPVGGQSGRAAAEGVPRCPSYPAPSSSEWQVYLQAAGEEELLEPAFAWAAVDYPLAERCSALTVFLPSSDTIGRTRGAWHFHIELLRCHFLP